MAEPLTPLRVATVATYDHLHQTIAMVRSLRAVRSGPVEAHVLLVDHHDLPRPGVDDDGIVVHTPESVGVPRFGWLATKFTPGDLCCAMKPFILRHLVARDDSPVLFVDSDIVFYDDPADLLRHRPTAPFVATPHLTAPNGAGMRSRPSMGDIATAGMLNGGLFLVRPEPSSAWFLDEWAGLCTEAGAFVEPLGRQSEQQSFNWVTSFVPGTAVFTDPRYNVAYWNLQERPIRWAGLDGRRGGVELDGRPITCFHFSGYSPGGAVLSAHGGRVSLAASPTAAALCYDYDTRLAEAGMATYADVGYEYGTVEGLPLLGSIRVALRGSELRIDPPEGPFAEVAPSALAQLHERVHPSLAVPVYVPEAIAGRRDVHDALVVPYQLYAGPLVRWLDDGFFRQHDEGPICERFTPWVFDRRAVGPIAERLAAAVDIEGAAADALVRHDRARAIELLSALGDDAPAGLLDDFLDPRYRIAASEPVTCLRLLYDERTDLQAAFPDPLGADLDGFRWWLAHELPTQYELTDAVAAVAADLPLERSLASLLAFIARDDDLLELVRREGLDHNVLLVASHAAAVEPGLLPSDVLLVEWWLAGRSEAERAAALDPAIAASIEGPAGARWLARWGALHAPELPPEALRVRVGELQTLARVVPAIGVNLFGYARSPIGLGSMTRGLGAALAASGVPTRTQVLTNITMDDDFSLEDFDPRYGFDLPIDVVVSYPHIVHDPLRRFPRECRGRARVAYLAWEQRDVHPGWARKYADCDQVWALSTFTADSLASGFGRPVAAVPCVVEVDPAPDLGRADFGLPASAFVVGLVFDATSSILRKNPMGAALALAGAFGDRDDVVVVVKVNGGGHAEFEPAIRDVMAVLRAAGLGLQVRTEPMPRPHLHALVRCFDLSVSLHRAEGFGYNLAESMLLGVPVVATGYSGNLDYMHPGNSLLVPYEEVIATTGEGPFVPGSVWAEPDLDAAAAAFRSVYDDHDAAAARAVSAQRDVAAGFSASAVGARARRLLQEILEENS